MIPFNEAAQGEPLALLQEFVGQTAAGDNASADALTAGLHPQARGQMGLAGTTLAQKDDVALLADIFSRGQLRQQATVQTRGSMIVKHLQRLQQREPGLPHPAVIIALGSVPLLLGPGSILGQPLINDLEVGPPHWIRLLRPGGITTWFTPKDLSHRFSENGRSPGRSA